MAKGKKSKKQKAKKAKRKKCQTQKSQKGKKKCERKVGKEESTFITGKPHYAVAMENGKKIDRNLREERKPWGRIYTL